MTTIIENAAGGLLANEAYGLIGMLSSRIDAEIKLARGFKKELEAVKRQLTRLTKLLHGASCQSITNPLIVDWLKTIENVAYDADDLLDQWSYEALQDKIVICTRKRDKIKRGVSKPISRLRIGHKASDLTSLISNIYDDANKLGIRPIEVASGDAHNNSKHCHPSEDQETSKLRNQRHYVDDKLLIGRDEDLTHLVKLICDPNNTNSSHLTVISIVGLGKTTLCKRISKEQEVREFFNSIAIWLVISRSYDLLDVLNRMVEMLCRKHSSMKDRQALISELREKLKDRRYLLILDDVWDTIHWESLKSTLEEIGGSYGTTVLVTSRNKDAVGKMVTACYDSKGKNKIRRPYIYMLQGLSEADSWSLFLARISDDSLVDSEKEVIGRRMLKNCGGVPLAIRALGDLLRDQSLDRWKEIEKSQTWTKVDRNDILPSLRLSYDFLPSMTLKKCFAYCAIFGEDEVIDKNKLIYMWMAQGYLQPYEVMEDKGEEYVEHLMNSSLFQEAELDDFGKVKTFKMHDLIWSLARVVSVGECLCSNGDERSNEVLRHLLVPKQSKSRELTLTSYTKLRTCLLFKEFEHPCLHFWLKCKHLRVLNIGWNWSEDLDWEPLGSLIHLRYFEFDVDNGLGVMQSNLGEHITKLYHLQTLCINNLCIVKDPCSTQFPKQIGNLVNLRHILDNDSIGIPMGLSLLTALQTFPAMNLEMNWGGRLSDLGSLTNLRGTLEIHNICFVDGEEEAYDRVLHNKSYLDSLVLRWGYNKSPAVKDNPHANEILESLQPNANLKMLQIWNHDGTRFPRWLTEDGSSSLSNLVSLKIYRCKAKGILTLESFRSLRFLQVEYCKRLTIVLPKEGFQCCNSLEQIALVGCYQVRNFVDLSTLTQLRSLTLKNNQLLGLGSLPCLREVHTDELVLLALLSEDSPVCKSLEVLTLEGFQLTDNDDHTTVLPDQLKYLRALQCLTIGHSECLETIPEWLGKLTSLRELHLYGLPKLKNLPSLEAMRCLSNLKSLEMAGCPLLLADVESESGEWLKIAHIPPFIHY
ncbi:disease resistance protein RGA2-like isoform X2 [Chenopodium quinoa]|uniref:Uncharacterized protein n=1 Tax=Chenopodium quinoa TaxID=63459 RepID=A0A803MRB6_CHEQI|nr:disease resistance protein RGA2-like isoform X2 [Chenopodium quinoa]